MAANRRVKVKSRAGVPPPVHSPYFQTPTVNDLLGRDVKELSNDARVKVIRDTQNMMEHRTNLGKALEALPIKRPSLRDAPNLTLEWDNLMRRVKRQQQKEKDHLEALKEDFKTRKSIQEIAPSQARERDVRILGSLIDNLTRHRVLNPFPGENFGQESQTHLYVSKRVAAKSHVETTNVFSMSPHKSRTPPSPSAPAAASRKQPATGKRKHAEDDAVASPSKKTRLSQADPADAAIVQAASDGRSRQKPLKERAAAKLFAKPQSAALKVYGSSTRYKASTIKIKTPYLRNAHNGGDVPADNRKPPKTDHENAISQAMGSKLSNGDKSKVKEEEKRDVLSKKRKRLDADHEDDVLQAVTKPNADLIQAAKCQVKSGKDEEDSVFLTRRKVSQTGHKNDVPQNMAKDPINGKHAVASASQPQAEPSPKKKCTLKEYMAKKRMNGNHATASTSPSPPQPENSSKQCKVSKAEHNAHVSHDKTEVATNGIHDAASTNEQKVEVVSENCSHVGSQDGDHDSHGKTEETTNGNNATSSTNQSQPDRLVNNRANGNHDVQKPKRKPIIKRDYRPHQPVPRKRLWSADDDVARDYILPEPVILDPPSDSYLINYDGHNFSLDMLINPLDFDDMVDDVPPHKQRRLLSDKQMSGASCIPLSPIRNNSPPSDDLFGDKEYEEAMKAQAALEAHGNDTEVMPWNRVPDGNGSKEECTTQKEEGTEEKGAEEKGAEKNSTRKDTTKDEVVKNVTGAD